MRSRFSRNVALIASVSFCTTSSLSSGMAARWSGRDPPPSRNEPALATASITFSGPTVQVTRQPGYRQFFVSPSKMITGSRLTSST